MGKIYQGCNDNQSCIIVIIIWRRITITQTIVEGGEKGSSRVTSYYHLILSSSHVHIIYYPYHVMYLFIYILVLVYRVVFIIFRPGSWGELILLVKRPRGGEMNYFSDQFLLILGIMFIRTWLLFITLMLSPLYRSNLVMPSQDMIVTGFSLLH